MQQAELHQASIESRRRSEFKIKDLTPQVCDPTSMSLL